MVRKMEDEATVVVIDDEESMCEGCRQVLEEEGYRAEVARDGEQGLRLVEDLRPNVVLVDLKMPGMSGMEVLEKIREIDPSTVSIVITGYGTADSAAEAAKLGARGYIHKPFDEKVLLGNVRRGVQGQRIQRAPRATPKALDTEQFLDFVDKMIADQAVVGVKNKEEAQDRFVFGPLQSTSELRLDYDVTMLPPKKYLLPPRETLLKFNLGDSPTAEPCVEEPRPTVLIGIHPYDMIAVNQLDRLMSETNPDPNYLTRRAALTVIGVDPERASENAFWGAMDCAVVHRGFDLWLTEMAGIYVIEVGTDKGASLLQKYAEARDATKWEFEARTELREELREMTNGRNIQFRPGELPSLLRRSFDHGVWEQNAQKCLSCGSCNLVCPTCYCFDVKDDVDISMKSGERYRVWDGCVLEDFAKVGTGENFREERLQRYRHRFYRKGMYLYDKYGHIACVGCGRCVAACLPDIADPVAVYNTLKEG